MKKRGYIMCVVIVGIVLLCIAMSFIIKSGDDAALGNAYMEETQMTSTSLNNANVTIDDATVYESE